MPAVYRFDDWELRVAQRQLLRQGMPAALGGRAFDLLLVLIEQADRLLSTDELLERVWPGLAVEPNNLQVQVWALRRLIGPGAIANVARRGYRFTRPVRSGPDPAQGDAPGMPIHAPPGRQGRRAAAATPWLPGDAGWLARVGSLQAPALVTLTGAVPAMLRLAAEELAAQRRAGGGTALWRIAMPAPGAAPPCPAWPDAADPLWRRLAAAPGQLLLLDCQHAPQQARQLAQAARRAAPVLQLLATAAQPLGLAGEVVVDLSGQAQTRPPLAPAPAPALRWQSRGGPLRR